MNIKTGVEGRSKLEEGVFCLYCSEWPLGSSLEFKLVGIAHTHKRPQFRNTRYSHIHGVTPLVASQIYYVVFTAEIAYLPLINYSDYKTWN